jgi:hypothetical protein
VTQTKDPVNAGYSANGELAAVGSHHRRAGFFQRNSNYGMADQRQHYPLGPGQGRRHASLLPMALAGRCDDCQADQRRRGKLAAREHQSSIASVRAEARPERTDPALNVR